MGVVVPHGVLFRGSTEGKIRQKLIEENLLDAIIGLPEKLFYGAAILPGHVYIAPPDHHVLIEATRMRLSSGAKVHYARPAADPMFISAAASHGQNVIGIVLSGGDGDGADGLLAIKQAGGRVIVQDPAEAQAPSMPHTAIATVHPDAILPISAIAKLVGGLCGRSAQANS